MLRLLVVLIPSLLLALGGSPEGGQQANPIASLLPFVLMGLVVYFIVRRSRRKGKRYKPTPDDIYRQRPPTERQMAFIDLLMQEREVETWILEKEPETIQEASEFIETLKKQPMRRDISGGG